MTEIKHELFLSTIDKEFYSTPIKVRNSDIDTQVLKVEVSEYGKPKSFEGLTPFFCLMARKITGQGVSEEPVKVYNDTLGTLEYTMSANAFQMIGQNEAYFSFKKETKDGEWVEQFSTRSFKYIVEESIHTIPFKDSNYFWTFEELYRKFNQYIKDGKTSWEDFVESNKDIIEALDPNGELLIKLQQKTYKANNVEQMKKLKAEVNSTIETQGFYFQDDGGAAKYTVYPEDTLEINNFDTFQLENGKIAKYLFNGESVKLEQFGANGDGETDDYSFMDFVLKNYKDCTIEFVQSNNYYFSEQIYFNTANDILGKGNTVYTDYGIKIDGHYHRQPNFKNFWIVPKIEQSPNIAIEVMSSSGDTWGSGIQAEKVKIKNFDIGFKLKSAHASFLNKNHVQSAKVCYLFTGDNTLINNQNILEQNMAIGSDIGFVLKNFHSGSLTSNTIESCETGYLIDMDSNNTLIESTWFEKINNAAVAFGEYKDNSIVYEKQINTAVEIKRSRFFKEAGAEYFVSENNDPLIARATVFSDVIGGYDLNYFANAIKNIAYKNIASTEAYVYGNSAGTFTNSYDAEPFGQRRIFHGRNLTGGWRCVIGQQENILSKSYATMLVKFKIKVSKNTQIFANYCYESPSKLLGESITTQRTIGRNLKEGIWENVSFILKIGFVNPTDAAAYFRFNLWNHQGAIDFDMTDILIVDITNHFGNYAPTAQFAGEIGQYYDYVFSGQRNTKQLMVAKDLPDRRFFPEGTLFYSTGLKKMCVKLEDYWYDPTNGEKINLS